MAGNQSFGPQANLHCLVGISFHFILVRALDTSLLPHCPYRITCPNGACLRSFSNSSAMTTPQRYAFRRRRTTSHTIAYPYL